MSNSLASPAALSSLPRSLRVSCVLGCPRASEASECVLGIGVKTQGHPSGSEGVWCLPWTFLRPGPAEVLLCAMPWCRDPQSSTDGGSPPSQAP